MRADAIAPARHREPSPRVLAVDARDAIALIRAAAENDDVVWIVVKGGSMSPAIPAGSQVLVQCLDRAPRSSDVVLAESPRGRLLLHRVRRVSNGQVVLRGDGMLRDDPPCPTASVIARATHVRIGGLVVPISHRPAPGVVGRAMLSIRWTVRRWLRS